MGNSMQSSTNRVQLFARGFFLITAFVLAQHLAVSPAMADTATPACPCSIWSASADTGTESGDPSPTGVNLGVKFHSDIDGYIKAIRFYKHANNTGTHTGYIWSSAGAQLASATVTTETATGWQQVALSSPLAITAGTDYIVSYYAPNRAWPHNINYFNTFGVDSPPLHIVGGGGNNGVFAYGVAGLFPTTFEPDHASNYFVDVVFEGTSTANTTAPTVTSMIPANAATGVDPNTNLTFNFSKEIDANSVNGVNVQLLDGATPV